MEYRDRFISEMDANTIIDEFLYKNIIPEGVQQRISKTDGPKQQNEILHAYLVRTCTDEALMRACGIIAAVPGNPKMATLVKDMQRSLESGVCVCMCVSMCASTSPLKHCSHSLCIYVPCVCA